MRKDIDIPEVKDVHIAAIREFNEDHHTWDWNAYLINAQPQPIELVLIVSQGHGYGKKTSLMRHKLGMLPAKSYAKIEFMEDSVLKLNNEFSLTFFANNRLFEKKFVFPAKSIVESKVTTLPIMQAKGILAG